MPKKSLTKRIAGKILLPVGKVLFWLLRREPSRTLLTAVTAALLVSAVTALAVVLTNPDALTSGSVLSADNWNRVVNKVLQIGDISTTDGKACTSNGGKIDCTSDGASGGLSDLISVRTASTSSTWHFGVTAYCDSGEKAIGGGCRDMCNQGDGGAGSTAIDASYPDSDSSWRCHSRDINTPCTRTLTAYAICVR